MSPRSRTLLEIRRLLEAQGPEDAVKATRAAFEAGRLHVLDLPEVLFALRAGSSAFLEALAGREPGRCQFHRFAA